MTKPKHAGDLAGDHWNPGQYLRFADHRLRPAVELLNRVPLTAPEMVFDLGCGTGRITCMMAERWPSATIHGLDNSREMIETAKTQPANVCWISADIAEWNPAVEPDLIYSNAALHWLDGHEQLFPRLAGLLRAGGCLAVQMPLSWHAPSHRLMRETLADGGPAKTALGSQDLRRAMARNWVAEPAAYYNLLVNCTKMLDIWESEYLQILSGEDPVLEWVRGTGLRPVLQGLGEREREIFLAEYARRLRDAYKMRPDGHTLYPFRRLFIVATV